MEKLFTIDCGEIYLQEFRVEDSDAIYEITSQPEVYEFLPDWRTTKEKRLYFVTKYEIPSNKGFLASLPNIEGLSSLYSLLKLAIIHKETNRMIGFVSTGIKEELPEPNREIAYAISKDYRNKGYTTKAVRALLHFLFDQTNLEVINAIALTQNIRSIKVIQKSGFTLLGDIEIENQKYHHFTLHKNDWQSHS
ncbi:GNAT family N-acetyltransferase [Paenibacillus sp. YN15]|uniref:GNAT family N-acetyltransferase n=1 Tax=Paenibacillus sp. YN15 TaxID=1742774 RepID=UPI000DCDC199|nr:GNAT family N-acetyltransferase [Paenibacillus sp. YN15]RAV05558.1 GNAT family N-acetyltransferase [Paenibacillus sp. YN15]